MISQRRIIVYVNALLLSGILNRPIKAMKSSINPPNLATIGKKMIELLDDMHQID